VSGDKETQPVLFNYLKFQKAVNVASVPQRSPFRYPGGKTWLVPHIRAWLRSLSPKATTLVEPFAGGAIVSLTVAAEGLAEHVVMIELDHQVASVWTTIINDDGGGEWLAQQILGFRISRETVEEVLNTPPRSTRELAFQTILKNRVYHGGILAPGSAPLKYGENGRGIASRWYPETLARRIRNIVLFRSKITFIEGDGLEYMASDPSLPDTAYFIDPPYTAGKKSAGKRLYTHYLLDHKRLFDLTARLGGPFLMTYDDDPAIIELATAHRFAWIKVAMMNTHHANMMELLISRDLSWAQG